MATLYDLNRICKSHYDCVGCPLEDLCDFFPSTCGEDEIKRMEDIIDKWVEEHKQNSYLADFKNKFPHARINDNGIPGICLHSLYGDFENCERRCLNMSLINISYGISSPCKECTKRHMGCHSRCSEYLEYKKKLEDIRKTEREEARFRSYHIETVSKIRRRK